MAIGLCSGLAPVCPDWIGLVFFTAALSSGCGPLTRSAGIVHGNHLDSQCRKSLGRILAGTRERRFEPSRAIQLAAELRSIPHFSQVCRPDRANPMPAGTSVAISDAVSRQAVTISRAGLRCSGNDLRPPVYGEKSGLSLRDHHLPADTKLVCDQTV